MYDSAIMTTVANAYNGYTSPNGVENPRVTNEAETGLKTGTPNPDQSERVNTDSVELSQESINLARLNSNQPFGELLEVNVREAAVQTQNTNPQVITFNSPANAGPNQEPIIATGTTPLSGPVVGGILRESFPGALETNRTLVAEAPENVVKETSNTASVVGLTDNVAVLQTREKEQGAKELNLKKENSVIPEVQTNPAPRSNGFLNETRGLSQQAPIPAATIAPDYPKNQEQILLQQIGSQIAQTTPPYHAISLLG